ncbi:hypothetical protein Rsub_08274 [Raphidocelis subcapitata]|uniref:Sulfotransferase n=1 Tax=Raphidocelis subcapitata TaxID=307507 RepID=A0A2V0PBG9_9CHLO|nr:hypothetical protein Rsub_08274 [Raphidocelis subcapitata]|eukprot:GBF95243.1 hypothetical protein Rsub_08274 [Raphidocelis subcapitata]
MMPDATARLQWGKSRACWALAACMIGTLVYILVVPAAKGGRGARALSTAAVATPQAGWTPRIGRWGNTSWPLDRAATQPGFVSAGAPPSGDDRGTAVSAIRRADDSTATDSSAGVLPKEVAATNVRGSNGSDSASKGGGSSIVANTTTNTTANSSGSGGGSSKGGGSIIVANTTTNTTANSSGGGGGSSSGGANRSRSTGNKSGAGSRTAAVAACDTFEYLRKAHALPPAQQERFNFPHALILGYPKCATTSLWGYLDQHPQALASHPKPTSACAAWWRAARPWASACWRP